VKGEINMNSCYNYGGCGCNSMSSFPYNPFGCGGCCTGWSYPVTTNMGMSYGSGCTWFAIVLVVFLLLIICGCTKIC